MSLYKERAIKKKREKQKVMEDVVLCEEVSCTYDGQCTNEFTGKRWICKGCVFNKALTAQSPS
jgi:hypothetical protein